MSGSLFVCVELQPFEQVVKVYGVGRSVMSALAELLVMSALAELLVMSALAELLVMSGRLE